MKMDRYPLYTIVKTIATIFFISIASDCVPFPILKRSCLSFDLSLSLSPLVKFSFLPDWSKFKGIFLIKEEMVLRNQCLFFILFGRQIYNDNSLVLRIFKIQAKLRVSAPLEPILHHIHKLTPLSPKHTNFRIMGSSDHWCLCNYTLPFSRCTHVYTDNHAWISQFIAQHVNTTQQLDKLPHPFFSPHPPPQDSWSQGTCVHYTNTFVKTIECLQGRPISLCGHGTPPGSLAASLLKV